MNFKTYLFALLIFFTVSSVSQNIIHVPADQPTIQAGIDAASDGDIVLVDEGIYYENINFNGKAITVKSHYDPVNKPDSNYLFNTIIDGSKPADTNKASVVLMSVGSDTNTVIQGFTLQNGCGSKNGSTWVGGGVYCRSGGKIINNRIINDTIITTQSALGGGIYAWGNAYNTFYIICNNIIENNYVQNINNDIGPFGSGIFIFGSQCVVENNVIQSNVADGRPYGVGITLERSYGVINNNNISNNTGNHTTGSRSRGGGIYSVNNYPNLIISNNLISKNHLNNINGTLEAGGGIQVLNTGGYDTNRIRIDRNIIRDNSSRKGGGISITDVHNITVSNNVIKSNGLEYYGGGIHLEDYNKDGKDDECIGNGIVYNEGPYVKTEKSGSYLPVIVNNTIISNSAQYNGGGIISYMSDNEFVAFNNIIYDNDAGSQGSDIYLQSNCNAYLYYNNIDVEKIGGFGIWEGDGNILVDPCMQDDSIHLSDTSCCINKAIATIEINGITYICPAFDIDGQGRPKQGQVDIGADECYGFTEIEENNIDLLNVILYPNPITNYANIQYNLLESCKVTLKVYNHLGQFLENMVDTYQQKGIHKITWHTEGLPAGIYIYRVKAGEQVGSGKIIKQ